jgi:hypothetical protein
MVKLKKISQDKDHIRIDAHVPDKNLNHPQFLLILFGKMGIGKKDHLHDYSTEVIMKRILPGPHAMPGVSEKPGTVKD